MVGRHRRVEADAAEAEPGSAGELPAIVRVPVRAAAKGDPAEPGLRAHVDSGEELVPHDVCRQRGRPHPLGEVERRRGRDPGREARVLGHLHVRELVERIVVGQQVSGRRPVDRASNVRHADAQLEISPVEDGSEVGAQTVPHASLAADRGVAREAGHVDRDGIAAPEERVAGRHARVRDDLTIGQSHEVLGSGADVDRGPAVPARIGRSALSVRRVKGPDRVSHLIGERGLGDPVVLDPVSGI